MADLLAYTCPCCGGSLKFDSKSQHVKCEFCDTEFNVTDLQAYDDSLKNTPEEKTDWEIENNGEFTEDEGYNIYTCKTCGGEVMCDENTTSTTCPYCGNPVLFTGRLSNGLKPNYVIPFKLTSEDARNNLNNYFKGKLLLPGDFKKLNQVKEITSLYVPYWVFDAKVDGAVTFKATRVKHERRGDYEYTHTSYYRIVRNGKVDFEHIPVDASRKMDDKMMESIEPFDFNDAKPFSQAYLAGYPADKYDVSKEENFERANTRIKQGTVEAFLETVNGYDTVAPQDCAVQYRDSKASYCLYPVWTLNSEYKGDMFKFAMNAQTGKLVGNLPMSGLRFTILLLSTFLIFFGIAFGLTILIAGSDAESLLWSTVIGLIVGGVSSGGISYHFRKQLKPVKFQYGAAQYRVPNSRILEVSKDIYLYTKTTSRRVSSSNNKR